MLRVTYLHAYFIVIIMIQKKITLRETNMEWRHGRHMAAQHRFINIASYET